MEEKDLKAAADLIRSGQSFLIACHVRPDGDTLGCALALAGALRRTGKQVEIVSPDGVPATYRFLPGANSIIAATDKRGFHAAIAPDCDGLERVGDALEAVQSARRILSIDHHSSKAPFGDVQLYDATAAATAEIVVELFDRMGTPIDEETAVCLMTGLVSDTGAFRFQNVTPKTFLAAARLASAGASPHEIARLVYESRSAESTRLLGVALAGLKTDETHRIVWAVLTREDFERTGATDGDTEGIVNHLQAVKNAGVALLFRETPDSEAQVSLRSREIDVSKIAQVFGGGGHPAASGCTVRAPAHEAEQRVIEETRRWTASST